MHNPQEEPFVLTFEKEKEFTIEELMKKYIVESGYDGNQDFLFELQNGFQLSKEKTVQQLCKEMRIDSTEGILIAVKEQAEDECCMMTMIESEKGFNKSAKEIPFLLPNSQLIYLSLTHQATYDDTLTKLVNEIKRLYGITMEKQSILVRSGEKEGQLIKFGQLKETDEVEVAFHKDHKDVKLPDTQKKSNSFVVIKGCGIKPTRFHFDDISRQRVRDVLNRIERREDWGRCGLNLNDFILRPHEKF